MRTRFVLAIITPWFIFGGWLFVQLMDYPLLRNPASWFALMSLGGLMWLVPEYVAVGRSRPFGVIASVLLRPLMAVGLFLLHEEVRIIAGVEWSNTTEPWIMLAPLGTGLLILAHVFRLFAIPLAMAYLPGMWFILFALLYPFALSRPH